ncbi:O-antigen ligase family protein [Vibrio coralliirubri]|uniref:O-antigen ligase family protein n=1 Tax=Vibrio coralliirubri TaxID=1516159 RepID=UPI00142F2B21|nr:O-antigen ligase family protein [Vibrio coralliirubri]
MSLLISKSAIYISLLLLLVFQLILVLSKVNSSEKKLGKEKNFIFIVSISTFFLGVMITLPYNLELDDLSEYIRKSILLLLFPLLTIQLHRNKNLHVAKVCLLTGLLISLSYALYNLVSLGYWNGQRVASFWDVGRWSEVLGYLIALIIPFSLEKQNEDKRNIKIYLLSITCVFFLLISGGRGPLLAVMITLGGYLLIRHPKILLSIVLLLLITVLFGQEINVISSITERVSSIFDTKASPSNIARLVMWKHGFKFIYYNITNDWLSFLFGVGIHNFEGQYAHFIESIGMKQHLIDLTENNFSFSDMHNTYLDLMIKLGAVYLLAYVFLLGTLFNFFFIKRNHSPSLAYSGMSLISTYSITGIFYTSGLGFQTTIFLALVALCYALITNDEYYYEK